MTLVIDEPADDPENPGTPRSRGDEIFESLGRRGPGSVRSGVAHKVPGYLIVPDPKLGEGKFSTVYRARDLHIPRDVAIKILREGSHPDEVQRERLENEARALAKLQGTPAGQHIVEIYSRSRSNQGPHFLILELVEGRSLADRIKDRGPLPARDAAALVKLIAEVMSIVHQLGIIHRDLKPSNILLDHDDSPKITDFGLAQFADDQHGLTVDGEILGTIEYMPPEQAGACHAEVDALSDLYSIGVILYECLTGNLPFRGPDLTETLLMIRSGREPVPPERLVPSVPHDLSTICLKCLSHKKEARYPGAAELAEDLGRFLAMRPILARRAGTPERLVKLIRRNRGVSALIGLVIASVAVGIVGTLVYARKAILQEDRAIQNADLRFHALENVLTAVTGEKLRRAGQRPLQVELINDLLPQFEAVLKLEGDDPATRNLQGMAWTNLATIHRELNEMPQALEATRKSEGLFRTLVKLPRFKLAASVGLGTSLSHKGTILGLTGEYAEAIAALAEAAQLLEPQATNGAPNLAERMGHVHNIWGNCLMRRNQGSDPVEATRHYREASDYFGRGATTLRSSQDWQARTLSNLALILQEPLNQPAEAVEAARRAADLARVLDKKVPNDLDSQDCVASCLTNLAEITMVQGDRVGALPLFEEVLKLYEHLGVRFPDNVDFRWGVAMTCSNLGSALALDSAPAWPKAIEYFERADAIYQSIVKETGQSKELNIYIDKNREHLKTLQEKQKLGH